jgi:hypothetical protein
MIDERCADPTHVRKASYGGLYEDQRLRKLLAYARKMESFAGLSRGSAQTSAGIPRKEDLTEAVCAVLLHIPAPPE